MLLALLLLGCAKKEGDAARITHTINQMQQALEERVRRDFSRHIAPNYHDNHGNDKAALNNLVRAYMLSHQRPKIVVKIISITPKSAELYQVKLSAAAAAAKTQSGFSADLKYIEADFIKDGSDFLLLSARWEY